MSVIARGTPWKATAKAPTTAYSIPLRLQPLKDRQTLGKEIDRNCRASLA